MARASFLSAAALALLLVFGGARQAGGAPSLRSEPELPHGRELSHYHEVVGEELAFLMQFNESEFDPRHVIIDGQGRRLATHFKMSWSELESEMVCRVQPWDEAQALPGWCPDQRYPKKYKPCPDCFIDNWCSTNKPWFGITCNGPMMTGRIIRLEFEGRQIGGQIYKNFPYFKKIQKIGLLSNDLSGGIPANLGGCKALTHMSLDKNTLSGNVPGSLGGLKAITYLNVGNNQLAGQISGALGGMSAIVRLYFNNNQFNGAIPASLGSLQHLSYLSLATNALSGVVPASLCQLQKTTVIKVWENPALQCYSACLAHYSWFVRDNDPHKGKVLCCCEGCSYVEVTVNERNNCPPTWPTASPVCMPTAVDAEDDKTQQQIGHTPGCADEGEGEGGGADAGAGEDPAASSGGMSRAAARLPWWAAVYHAFG